MFPVVDVRSALQITLDIVQYLQGSVPPKFASRSADVLTQDFLSRSPVRVKALLLRQSRQSFLEG